MGVAAAVRVATATSFGFDAANEMSDTGVGLITAYMDRASLIRAKIKFRAYLQLCLIQILRDI